MSIVNRKNPRNNTAAMKTMQPIAQLPYLRATFKSKNIFTMLSLFSSIQRRYLVQDISRTVTRPCKISLSKDTTRDQEFFVVWDCTFLCNESHMYYV